MTKKGYPRPEKGERCKKNSGFPSEVDGESLLLCILSKRMRYNLFTMPY